MTSMLQRALTEMMAAEMKARETELYAAWRAGYDHLYVVSSFNLTDLSLEFVPSNNPELRFRGRRVERYDLRREDIEPEAWEFLMEYTP